MSKYRKNDQLEKSDSHVSKRLNTGKEPVDENSEVVKYFRQYAALLDQKHDRYERLVKVSRDVTIESKRIIFLLHTVERLYYRNRENVLTEAKKRLDNLVKNNFFQIAKELEGEDPYQYHRAFTFGLQEFIEAYTFYHHLMDKTLNHWNLYQNMLKYNEKDEIMQNELVATLPPIDYILGVADLSGELMRMCINNLGSGDVKGCFETCEVVKKLYAGFLSIGSYKTKELSEKTSTLRQSLLKMENVCYNINIRSKELPEQMLIHLVSTLEGEGKEY